MKAIITLIIFVSIYAGYGVYVSHFSLSIMPTGLQPSHPPQFYDYKGITNVHSKHSNGSGSYLEIISAATKENFDFLFFTDINSFKSRNKITGYQNRLLVFTGGEYSYLNSHLLQYKAHSNLNHKSRSEAQLYFTDFLSQKRSSHTKTFVALAHPLKKGYQWLGDYPTSLEGIEVINLDSVWEASLSKSKTSFIFSLFTYFFNPRHSLIRLYSEPKKELSLWDQLNQKQKTVGLAGHNTTSKATLWEGFRIPFPSYQSSFSFISNHVILRSELTGLVEKDQKKIFHALKKGNLYFSLDFLENPKGFITYAVQNGQKYLMGSSLNSSSRKKIKIFAHLPQKPNVPFEVVLFKNGQRYKSLKKQHASFSITQPGVYRITVRVIPTFPLPDSRRWITWIYSNPFYIKES